MSIGGVAIASGSGSRSHSNRDTPQQEQTWAAYEACKGRIPSNITIASVALLGSRPLPTLGPWRVLNNARHQNRIAFLPP